jgi:hypothetical protein
MDPVPPDSWWETYDILLDPLVLEGNTVLTNETVDNYYVSHHINPPLLYPAPSPSHSQTRH